MTAITEYLVTISGMKFRAGGLGEWEWEGAVQGGWEKPEGSLPRLLVQEQGWENKPPAAERVSREVSSDSRFPQE